jgi:hypothetical protein
VAWTQKNIYAGKGTQTAGLVVNTNFSGKGRMMAQINGQTTPDRQKQLHQSSALRGI